MVRSMVRGGEDAPRSLLPARCEALPCICFAPTPWSGMNDAELEKLNMQLLEGCPSKKELWKMGIDLLAEVEWLRKQLDHSELGFQECFKDLAEARAAMRKLKAEP